MAASCTPSASTGGIEAPLTSVDRTPGSSRLPGVVFCHRRPRLLPGRTRAISLTDASSGSTMLTTRWVRCRCVEPGNAHIADGLCNGRLPSIAAAVAGGRWTAVRHGSLLIVAVQFLDVANRAEKRQAVQHCSSDDLQYVLLSRRPAWPCSAACASEATNGVARRLAQPWRATWKPAKD